MAKHWDLAGAVACAAGFGIGHLQVSVFQMAPVAQWIRHWPTEPGIAGSSPAGVICDQLKWSAAGSQAPMKSLSPKGKSIDVVSSCLAQPVKKGSLSVSTDVHTPEQQGCSA